MTGGSRRIPLKRFIWPSVRGCALFFFNDTATTEIYTLSLHDALPISSWWRHPWPPSSARWPAFTSVATSSSRSDRKSTRLNSSHSQISYAVFCLKKNNHTQQTAAGVPRPHAGEFLTDVHPTSATADAH